LYRSASPPPAWEVVPAGVFDFDATTRDDPHQGGLYVKSTFSYYKEREVILIKKITNNRSLLNALGKRS
jgi:hypothetical protein